MFMRNAPPTATVHNSGYGSDDSGDLLFSALVVRCSRSLVRYARHVGVGLTSSSRVLPHTRRVGISASASLILTGWRVNIGPTSSSCGSSHAGNRCGVAESRDIEVVNRRAVEIYVSAYEALRSSLEDENATRLMSQ